MITVLLDPSDEHDEHIIDWIITNLGWIKGDNDERQDRQATDLLDMPTTD